MVNRKYVYHRVSRPHQKITLMCLHDHLSNIYYNVSINALPPAGYSVNLLVGGGGGLCYWKTETITLY